ncbi:MAG: hypothetical protein B7Y43_17640 [Sphingomonas sp. 28-62-20]|uniref:site-specific integrase n=1 Tax=Sphingomonas sp. 28-62-20 TaxID=1970433 RepID=UPI000BCAED52|nr:MAG: hypothetical protein B7Y43_17640 [Sphingomonas sp. 28-62-20]
MKTSHPAIGRYLWDRPGSRSIWFRMAVPKQYQGQDGTKIIQRSLNTADRREASILAGKFRAELFEQWRGCVVPNEEDLEEAATVVGYEMELERMDAGRVGMRNSSISLFDANVGWHQSELRHRMRAAATNDSKTVSYLADEIVDALGWMLPKHSDGYARLCELFRLAGAVDASTDNKLIQRVGQRLGEAAPAGQTILELFERFAAEQLGAGKRPDTVNGKRIVVQMFADCVGNDRRLAAIGRDEIRDWRNAIAALPRNYRNSNAYKNLDMRAAVAKAAVLKGRTIDAQTVNSKLSALSSFLRWAVRNGYADTNGCDGLFVDADKAANERCPFTVNQLNTILGSPLFKGFLRDGAEHKPGNVLSDDWRKWIPLIAMFSGARIGEIAQLRVSDIEELHDRWFIHLRDDTKTGQHTKSRKNRMVPVHRKLEGIGFLRFHAAQVEIAGGDETRQLFPEMVANSRDHIGAKASKWWRRYLGKIGVKEEGDGLGSHAFRHYMADELRTAGFLDDQFGPLILGHQKGSVTGKYGRMPQGTATMLCEMIDGVKFDGVNFNQLCDQA